MKIAKLNIEGYIGGADIMSMFSGEETFNLSKLKKFLDSLESDVTDIHVYINSGGGSVTEGWAIYDKLKASGKTITTIVEGIVGSIATVIYMAGSVRKLHENSKFFIHNPYWMPNEASPMEGNDLIALGEDLKNEQSKILDFYSKTTGTSLDAIEPLMNKATDLTSIQAIEMGFAHSVINEFVNQNHYKLVAMIDIKDKTNQNKTNMENKNEILAAINKMGTMLAKVFKGTIVNMDIAATNSAGEAVNLQIDTDTEDLVDKFAFLVDADGNKTPAPDDDYVDGSGRTVAVKGGKVTEVATKEEESTEPLDAIKAELETVKAELEAKKAEVLVAQTEATEIKASLETINTEFVALKKVVIGAGAKFETEGQNFKNDKQIEKPVSAFDHVAERLKRK